MAELASPESWCTGNGTVGSNPTPSAAGVSVRGRTKHFRAVLGRSAGPTRRALARRERLFSGFLPHARRLAFPQ